MPSILITGASRGLGLEFARQYAAAGWTVIATCRDPGAATDLAAVSGDVAVHALDVTDNAAVDALAGKLGDGGIDVLLNNAGIHGPRTHGFDDLDRDAWDRVMRTNVMAPLKMVSAFLPNLLAGNMRKIVSISSKMGSIGENNAGGSYIYRSSKAALNTVMKSLRVDLRVDQVAVAVLHPGWVSTDMGGASAPLNAKTSVAALLPIIARVSADDRHMFFDYDGSPIPW